MSGLTVRNLSLGRGQARIEDLSMQIRAGEIVALLGPEPGGPSVLFRVLAGKTRPERGEIFADGVDITTRPPWHRGLTHLPPDRSQATEKMLRRGGVLLLEEPHWPSDPALRAACRSQTREIARAHDTAVLMRTRDTSAALALPDRIFLMAEGRILQEGAPEEVYRHPRSRLAAELTGVANLIEGEVLGESEPGLWTVQTRFGDLEVTGKDPQARHVTLCWRPEQALEGEGVTNSLTGTVTKRIFHGPLTELELDLGGSVQRLLLPRSAVSEGAQLEFHIPPEDLTFLDPTA